MYRGCIVEFGPAAQLLSSPAHPYTCLLFDSIPSVTIKWNRKGLASAEMGTKEFGQQGCKFSGRCPLAQAVCAEIRPPAVKKDDGREVYCHFA